VVKLRTDTVEVQEMRLIIATTVLFVGVLIGLASAGTSAQSQNLQAGITSGEKLSLWLDPDKLRFDCTVIEVRGDFVGCQPGAPSFGRTSVETWYNLRLVARIERPARQQ
jgi:hypothetical protein